MAKIMVGMFGLKSYPGCNTMEKRVKIAGELRKIADGLENVNIGMGTKDDFRDSDTGWTAFHFTKIGNNHKFFNVVFGVNIPTTDTGLGD
jgi:hypothetical protein